MTREQHAAESLKALTPARIHGERLTVERIAAEEEFLPRSLAYQCFADLNGDHAKAYLEALGFEVVKSGDTGRCGFAQTACGVWLSTNGYCHRKAA